MPPIKTVLFRSVTLFALAGTLAGCNKSPHDVAPVSGTVTIDGQPFTHGKVMFAPLPGGDNLHPGKAALGLLQPDGSFVLSTYGKGDGAVVGEHTVTIINVPPTTGAAKDEPKFKRARAPGDFRVIAGQDNHFDVKLSRQDVTRYSSQN